MRWDKSSQAGVVIGGYHGASIQLLLDGASHTVALGSRMLCDAQLLMSNSVTIF
jgi:hypothetical protein